MAAIRNSRGVRWTLLSAGHFLRLFVLLVSLLYVQTALAQSSHAPPMQSTVLDRVVAVVDDTAILASDVDEEMRFAAFLPGKEPESDNTPQRALARLIDRALIDQQRVLQPGLANISQKDVDQSIADMRKQLPACAEYHCNTDAGWQAFLQSHDFTQQELEGRVRERLAILKFIDLRFGGAVRVSNADVRKYYDETLKPELEHNRATVPDFQAVAPRIREILRQQRVSSMVDQWLKGLYSEGDVRILDPAYGNLARVQGSGPGSPTSQGSGQ